MTSETNITIQENIAFLAIQGRGPLNLLHKEAFDALTGNLREVASEQSVRAVILQGAENRGFSAGVDLQKMRDLTPLDAETFIRAHHECARGLLTLPLPVVAAIRGPCLGGALELALACDIRIAAEDAQFGLPEVRVGVPSVIEASLLPRTIGLGRARAMILTGETVDAQEALQMGLVDRVVSPDQLDDAALETARGFMSMSRYILSVQKDIIARWLEPGETEAAEYSIKAFALCFATSHPREAMTAFLEKREPRF